MIYSTKAVVTAFCKLPIVFCAILASQARPVDFEKNRAEGDKIHLR